MSPCNICGIYQYICHHSLNILPRTALPPPQCNIHAIISKYFVQRESAMQEKGYRTWFYHEGALYSVKVLESILKIPCMLRINSKNKQQCHPLCLVGTCHLSACIYLIFNTHYQCARSRECACMHILNFTL